MLDTLTDKISHQLRFSPWGMPKSRIHPTSLFGEKVWVKRDDELSFGISGTKLRKLSSVISHLKASRTNLVLTTGGKHSNHLPAAIQAFHEAKLDYQIWLKRGPDLPVKGNYGLLKLLMRADCIRWVEASDWEQRYKLMEELADSLRPSSSYLMREGADNLEALPGAMTLALDIACNQRKHLIEFETIAIDAGTGSSAIALILGLELLRLKKQILVVGMAMSKEEFFQALQRVNELLPLTLGVKPCDLDLSRIHYVRPLTAKSFGSTNAKIFRQIAGLAKFEGILVDPVYGAKLTLSIQNLLAEQKLAKPLLWIHSGGGFSVSGFWDKLAPYF